MKNNTNISGENYGRVTINNNSSDILQKYAEMQKQDEKKESERKRNKVKKNPWIIVFFILAAVLSVIAVLALQPMELAESIVCGIVLFSIMAVRIVAIIENRY